MLVRSMGEHSAMSNEATPTRFNQTPGTTLLSLRHRPAQEHEHRMAPCQHHVTGGRGLIGTATPLSNVGGLRISKLREETAWLGQRPSCIRTPQEG